nr:TraR/DksA C4-type zinc finger protein [Motiliproteus sediminis]
MDITINAIVGEQVREGAQQELRALSKQLQWLDGDDAGFCDDCGDAIPLARLEAVPVTRHCIRCAEKRSR